MNYDQQFDLLDELAGIEKPNMEITVVNDDPFCSRCLKQMVTYIAESIIICQSCGSVKPILITYIPYKNQHFDGGSYPYKRITHFRKHIRDLQGKVRMPCEIKHRMIMMFTLIQRPFQEFKQKGRKNFFNYSYILKKFLELLGHEDISSHLKYLKSKEKLEQHDAIWKKICEKFSWNFIKSKRAKKLKLNARKN